MKFVGAFALVFAAATPAFAQTPRLLFDAGATLAGGASAGKSSATYVAPDGTSVPQFSMEKSLGPAVGVNGHLSIRISSRVRIEAAARWARTEFRTKLSGDTDGADSTTATQSVDRFVVGGGAVVALKPFGRWHPFARGSFGWLRELSDDQSLYQDGWVGELGGGANFQWTETRGHFRPYGIRTDLWLDIRHGGLSFSEKSRILSPAFSAAVIFKL